MEGPGNANMEKMWLKLLKKKLSKVLSELYFIHLKVYLVREKWRFFIMVKVYHHTMYLQVSYIAYPSSSKYHKRDCKIVHAILHREIRLIVL